MSACCTSKVKLFAVQHAESWLIPLQYMHKEVCVICTHVYACKSSLKTFAREGVYERHQKKIKVSIDGSIRSDRSQ